MEVVDEVLILKSRINDLVSENEEHAKNLKKSAFLGKQLLEETQDLKRQLQELQGNHEAQIQSYKDKLENQEQERYTYKLKAEAAANEVNSIMEDYSSVKEKLLQISAQKDKEVNLNVKLRQKIDSLNDELEVARDLKIDEQLFEQNKKHVEARLTETINSSSHEESYFEQQLLQLQADSASDKLKLQCILDESEKKIIDTQVMIEKLREQNGQLKMELEEKECQSTSYFNALESSRREILELQVELQQMQAGEMDSNARGNSLFSEVDDRRKRLEDAFKTLRAKYHSLYQTNELNESRIKKLQSQITMQATSFGQEVNASHVFRLEQSLAQANNDIKKLLLDARIRESLSPATSTVASGLLKEQNNRSIPSSDVKDIPVQLKDSSNEARKQIDSLWLQLLSERDCGRETRKKLYACEKREELLFGENKRLKLKLYEIQNKVTKADTDVLKDYEQDKIKSRSKVESSRNPKSKSLNKESTENKPKIVVSKLDMKDECKQQ